VSGVGTDITTLMVGVNSQVQSHKLNEILVFTETQLVGKVETVVLVLLNRCNLATLENVLVNSGSDGWQLGN